MGNGVWLTQTTGYMHRLECELVTTMEYELSGGIQGTQSKEILQTHNGKS